MIPATYGQATLTYTGATLTERAGRWEIHFHLTVSGILAASTSLDVAAADEAAAIALGTRCLDHFGETGRIPNLPEQHDPERVSALEAVKLLRRHTGQDLSTCLAAWKRRNEPEFQGDAVLSLTSLMEAKVAQYTETRNAAWASQYANHLRQCEPTLDIAFPRVA